MSGWVAGAVVTGAVVGAQASKSATKTQTRAITEAASTETAAAKAVAQIQANALTQAASTEAAAAEAAAQRQAEAFRQAAAEQERGITGAAAIQTGAPQTVEDLYASVLQRAPDAEGLAYWQREFGPTLEPNELAVFRAAAQPELINRSTDPQGYAQQMAQLGVATNVIPPPSGIRTGFEVQAQASERAAAEMARGQVEAARLQTEQADRAFRQQQELMSPFRDAGINALGRIQSGLAPGGEFAQQFTADQFAADPGYAFRLSEGQKALERQAAARGGLISGSALKAATQFGQDMGSQEFQNAFNRFYAERQAQLDPLFDLYSGGMGTSSELAGFAGTRGANVANFLGAGTLGAAEAQARGILGAGQARSSGYLEDLQARAQSARDLSTVRASAYTGPAQFEAQGMLAAGQARAAGMQGAGQAQAQGMFTAGQAQAAGLRGAGEAQAAGRLGVANALTGAIGTGVNLYQQNQLLNRLYPASTPAMVYGGGF
jgi:hypothetical protein